VSEKPLLRCEYDSPRGKHRTEVTEATEGNDWDGGCEISRVGRRHCFGARMTREGGKHRTEVTEATEGND
jgi:hypothetical protein